MPSFSPKCLPDGRRYVRHAESESEGKRDWVKGKEREEMEKRVRQKEDKEMEDEEEKDTRVWGEGCSASCLLEKKNFLADTIIKSAVYTPQGSG